MTGADCEDGLMRKGNFICGVVEGFYGRPWTPDQRRILFKWTSKMGLNTYLYAPKDDCKHRAIWRDLYSVEEADSLTSLIECAHEHNIEFVYALSPGLDITYSSTKDVQYLKRKLEQVATFGCNAFALLFDDIDPELCEADKNIFQSIAAAQVSLTNEIYQHLGQPKFLFCPTEYCSARAVPTVPASEYLNTVGAKLLPVIDVMWTGPKVVSKKISIQSLEEVSKVLQRHPVIWDNIHANDYDPKRVFLGPYDGRSPEIIPYVKGVLTNPNCEFETNFIPLHSLAQWCKSNVNGVKKDIITGDRLSPIASDIKLETESEFTSDDDFPAKFDTRYQPKQALQVALNDWLNEVSTTRYPSQICCAKPILAGLSQSVNTCMSVTTPTATLAQETQNLLPAPPLSTALPAPLPATDIDNSSYLQPVMNPMNSLVNSVPELSETTLDSGPDMEPMDCVPPDPLTDAIKSSDNIMQVDNSTSSCSADLEIKSLHEAVTSDDLSLIVDMFYTPFEYGAHAIHLLQELHWIQSNANLVTENKSKTVLEAEEWHNRAKTFEEGVENIFGVTDRLFKIPNRSLFTELYPYLWDLRSILMLCKAYVQWLGLGQVPYLSVVRLQSSLTWCTKGYKDAFMSGDQEPWIFRGGLQAEFQHMLPIDGAHDLFFLKPPYPPLLKFFTLRPFRETDEAAIYEVCRKTCDDGMDGTDVFPDIPDLIGDRLVGGFVSISSEYCFVMEDDQGICGYALAALDAKQFRQKSEMAWIPSMCKKYPKPVKDELTPADEVVLSFHNSRAVIPENMLTRYPSLIRIDVIAERLSDPAMANRLLACILSALKTNGSIGVYCELNIGDKYLLEFYNRLGFFPIGGSEFSSEEMMYVGRII